MNTHISPNNKFDVIAKLDFPSTLRNPLRGYNNAMSLDMMNHEIPPSPPT